MQDLARKAIEQILDEPGDPASAIVTLNPANGDIEAMAESESYEKSQYNLAADGHRQPGSTFKAIDLADALSRGVDPNSTYYLSHTLEPGWLTGYPTYEVKTFEGTSLNKSINLVDATLTSDNTVYAQLAADLGESTVTDMAHKMGVVTHLSSYPAEALGGLTLGVTPLEMADVYATLADGGYRNTPIAITKVVFPDGHADTNWGTPHRVKVLSEGVTAEESSILKQNVESGTATRSAITCPTAAKTGTTSELVDAWLDGYTPNYATVVWMGYPNKRVSMTDVHGEPQQGGYLPAEIWHAYMSAVVEGKTCEQFKAAKEPISYEPFYGKFATTGESRSFSESSSEEHSETPHHSAKRAPEQGGADGPVPIETHETPAEPAPSRESPGNPAGGAAPGQ
ncbi:MAG TPA: penicillin-binding transpeptidase domain-containing protein, partial [Solirubrobacteraceae bacterium]|nr:penicillin-binding transpeptidase domain-containing protein [Solirubrobacteraceae bacterium]